jgi:hypothetical protein
VFRAKKGRKRRSRATEEVSRVRAKEAARQKESASKWAGQNNKIHTKIWKFPAQIWKHFEEEEEEEEIIIIIIIINSSIISAHHQQTKIFFQVTYKVH